jgi:hypothetical protein
MKKLVLIAIMWLFSGLVISEEIVVNKDGQAVLLKDDNTWELIDTSGDDGKVIFSIANAVDNISWYEKKNDMDEFLYWRVYGGCKYHLTVENRTPHKIKVGNFKLKTSLNQIYGRGALIQFGKVVEPGGSYTSGNNMGYDIGEIAARADDESKEVPTEERQKELAKQFGCKAQLGSIYLSAAGYPKFLTFSADAGIAKNAIKNFVKGSQNGMFPLGEEIKF